MNLINLQIIILFILSFILAGCGEPKGNIGPKKATSPKATAVATQSSVKLTGEVMGNAVDIHVILPPKTNVSLLNYNGSATVKGKIKSSSATCLSSFLPFNCKARLSVGNININSCSIGKNSANVQIILQRGKALKEGYSIGGIIIEPSWSCFYSPT